MDKMWNATKRHFPLQDLPVVALHPTPAPQIGFRHTEQARYLIRPGFIPTQAYKGHPERPRFQLCVSYANFMDPCAGLMCFHAIERACPSTSSATPHLRFVNGDYPYAGYELRPRRVHVGYCLYSRYGSIDNVLKSLTHDHDYYHILTVSLPFPDYWTDLRSDGPPSIWTTRPTDSISRLSSIGQFLHVGIDTFDRNTHSADNRITRVLRTSIHARISGMEVHSRRLYNFCRICTSPVSPLYHLLSRNYHS